MTPEQFAEVVSRLDKLELRQVASELMWCAVLAELRAERRLRGQPWSPAQWAAALAREDELTRAQLRDVLRSVSEEEPPWQPPPTSLN